MYITAHQLHPTPNLMKGPGMIKNICWEYPVGGGKHFKPLIQEVGTIGSEFEANLVYSGSSKTSRFVQRYYIWKNKVKQNSILIATLDIYQELNLDCVISHFCAKIIDPIMVDTYAHIDTNIGIRI